MGVIATRRAIIVIPATDKTSRNVTTASIDKVGGERTFEAGLVSAKDPKGPIVAYWCNWACTEATYKALVEQFGARLYDADKTSPEAVLKALGLTVPELKL